MKVFIKSRKGLLIGVILTAAVIFYAWELNAVPDTFQRVFLPLLKRRRTKTARPK